MFQPILEVLFVAFFIVGALGGLLFWFFTILDWKKDNDNRVDFVIKCWMYVSCSLVVVMGVLIWLQS